MWQAYQTQKPIVQKFLDQRSIKPIRLLSYQIEECDRMDQTIQETHSVWNTSAPGVGKTYILSFLAWEKWQVPHVRVCAPKSASTPWILMQKKHGLNICKEHIFTPESLNFESNGLLRRIAPGTKNTLLPKRSANMADPSITIPDLDPKDPQNFWDVTPKFVQLCEEGLMLIVDEAHKFKQQSGRLRGFTVLCRYIRYMFDKTGGANKSRLLLVTATPMDQPEKGQIKNFLYSTALIHAPIELKPDGSRKATHFPGLVELKEFLFQFVQQTQLIRTEEERKRVLDKFGSYQPPSKQVQTSLSSSSSSSSSFTRLPTFLQQNFEAEFEETKQDLYPINPANASKTTHKLFWDIVHRYLFGCTSLQMDPAKMVGDADYFLKYDLREHTFRRFFMLPEKDEFIYLNAVSEFFDQVTREEGLEDLKTVEEKQQEEKQQEVKPKKKKAKKKKEEKPVAPELDAQTLADLAALGFETKKEETKVATTKPTVIHSIMTLEMAKLRAIVQGILEALQQMPTSKAAIMLNYDVCIYYVYNVLNWILPGQVRLFTGDQTTEEREEYVDAFQQPNLKVRVLVGNLSAMNQSISLHDINGNFPRIVYITPSYRLIDLCQALFRPMRADIHSDPMILHIYAFIPSKRFPNLSKTKPAAPPPHLEEEETAFHYNFERYSTPVVREFMLRQEQTHWFFDANTEGETEATNRTCCREDRLLASLHKKSNDVKKISRLLNPLMPLPNKYLFQIPKEEETRAPTIATVQEWKEWGKQHFATARNLPFPPSLHVVYKYLKTIQPDEFSHPKFSAQCLINKKLMFNDIVPSKEYLEKVYTRLGAKFANMDKDVPFLDLAS